MNPGVRFRGVALRPRTLVMATEIALVALLGVQAARLIWIVAAPGPAPAQASTPTSASVDGTILARFDPFFRIPGSGLHEAPQAAEGAALQLYGVRAGPRGSAILGPPGGDQALYGVGETLPDGQVLAVVAADHVILASGGLRRRLEFPTSAAGTGLPPPPPPPTAPAAGEAPRPAYSGAQLAAAMALAPRMKDGRPAGYTVMPRGGQGAAILAQAGLAPGDVLLTVDGSELSRERLSELPSILAAADRVDVTYERGGQTLTTTLRMTPP